MPRYHYDKNAREMFSEIEKMRLINDAPRPASADFAEITKDAEARLARMAAILEKARETSFA